MAINNTGVLSGMNGLDNIRAWGGYIKPVMHHYDALPFWPIRKAMVGEYNIRIEIVSICVWGCHTFLLDLSIHRFLSDYSCFLRINTI
jgi:hypothetical protein